jgi:adenosylcobinamide-GDP ribazoletransferase
MISNSWLEDRAEELKAALAVCTRLPLMRMAPIGTGIGTVAIAKAAWAFPAAGILVGLVGAIAYGIAHRLGVPAWPAAALSVGATMLATGCLHEDGLADTADGFGGGGTREQKLDIMRDSHIGAYGVCALIVALLLRVSLIASLPSAHLAMWTLVASHAGARAVMMGLLFLLPPARDDGLSYEAGRPPPDSIAAAAILGFLLVAFCLGPWRGIIAAVFLLAALAVMTWLSSSQIEGQTGDTLGALEQISEITILLVALG